MRKAVKYQALLLAVAMVISLLAAMPLSADASSKPKTANDVRDAASFSRALRDKDVNVINISGAFTYNDSVFMRGRKVDVNLNGHTLSIDAPESSGVEIRDDSRFRVNGPGVLNVKAVTDGISSKSSSVFITTGEVTVNVSSTGSNAIAVNAEGRGMVTFTGSATADGSYYSAGVYTNGRSTVTITGDVSATGTHRVYGVHANWQGNIRITGNVSASGPKSVAAYSASDGTIDIFGNATAASTGSVGAYAEDKGRVFITGAVSGEASPLKVNDRLLTTDFPTRNNVSRPAPRDGKAWAEFKNGDAYIYLCQENVTAAAPWAASGTWRQLNGEWYFYDTAGNMVKNGWVQGSDGKWYWLKYNGKMARREEVSIDGIHYLFLRDGAMATGWVKDGGKWILFNPDGTKASGWIYQDGDWYYLNRKGEAQTGAQRIGGSMYFFHGDGRMATGWLQRGNTTWYYHRPDGTRVINQTVNIDGKDYNFNSSGICTNP